MVATTGFTGIGATLKMGDGASPEAFTSIGNLTTFGLEMQADEVDATHLLSTDGFREYKQGFKSVTVPFEGHFDPDNPTHDDSTGMIARITDGDSANFKADFSGADNGGSGAPTAKGVASFSGVFVGVSVNASEGMVTVSGNIRVSSSPTWGAS
jgi:hypothetical protein